MTDNILGSILVRSSLYNSDNFLSANQTIGLRYEMNYTPHKRIPYTFYIRYAIAALL